MDFVVNLCHFNQTDEDAAEVENKGENNQLWMGKGFLLSFI